MILSDLTLTARIAELFATPLKDGQIQPASVDLLLKGPIRLMQRPGVIHLNEPVMLDGSEFCDTYSLAPGEFALASTEETITVPDDLVARVEGRSGLGRLGLAVHVTAGFIDPGFRGQITLELANLGQKRLVFADGIRICQVTFHQMTTPAAKPYGAARGSSYNDQSGATPSRYRP